MRIFMFPGQGSQKRGMGEGLFDEIPEFRQVEQEVDAILGYSLRKMCLENPDENLKNTAYTQPCLYMVNALHYYKALASGDYADALLGHSLGEYNALLAAGVLDLLTGLKLVKKRGELMARATGGAMSAVIGLEAEKIQAVLRDGGLQGVDIANFNSPVQTVISGPSEDVRKATPLLEAAGARMVVALAVSAAFHSRYMIDAANEFGDYMAQFSLRSPRLPVIANVTAVPYPADSDAAIKSLLVKQISHPVQWAASVKFLRKRGAADFVELGPGNVLARLVDQIQV